MAERKHRHRLNVFAEMLVTLVFPRTGSPHLRQTAAPRAPTQAPDPVIAAGWRRCFQLPQCQPLPGFARSSRLLKQEVAPSAQNVTERMFPASQDGVKGPPGCRCAGTEVRSAPLSTHLGLPRAPWRQPPRPPPSPCQRHPPAAGRTGRERLQEALRPPLQLSLRPADAA